MDAETTKREMEAGTCTVTRDSGTRGGTGTTEMVDTPRETQMAIRKRTTKRSGRGGSRRCSLRHRSWIKTATRGYDNWRNESGRRERPTTGRGTGRATGDSSTGCTSRRATWRSRSGWGERGRDTRETTISWLEGRPRVGCAGVWHRCGWAANPWTDWAFCRGRVPM